MDKRAQTYDLNDVTHNSPLDEANTEEEDEELDDLSDHLKDDLDLQKDDFIDEPFHDKTFPDTP